MHESLPYHELIQVLTDLVDKQSSGTLFIHSDCNHAITFGLEKGRIFAIFHGARRGRKAIPLVGKISGGTYKFESASLGGISQELPATPEILHLLRTSADPGSAHQPTSSPATANMAVSVERKNQLCQQLKDLLAAHLGPIAEMVFDDATDEIGDFCSSPELAQQLIDKLSLDIDDAEEVAQFRSQAYSVIDSMLKS
jgi:hypothetical protein